MAHIRYNVLASLLRKHVIIKNTIDKSTLMKKITLLLATSALFTVAYGQAALDHICTYSDNGSMETFDYAAPYTVQWTSNTVRIVDVNQQCSGSALMAEVFTDPVIDIAINTNKPGDSIALAILTQTTLFMNSYHRSGTTLTPIKQVQYSLSSNNFRAIKTDKTPYGLSILLTHKVGTTEYSKGAAIRYSGQMTMPTDLTHVNCGCYSHMAADMMYHYFFYTTPTGVWVERRLNNMDMTYEGLYPLNTITNPVITDVQHTDTTIALETMDGSHKLVRQMYLKATTMGLTYLAELSHQVGPVHEEHRGRYVHLGITALGETLVKHTSNLSGTLAIQHSIQFGGNHKDFRAYPLGGGYLIWYAVGNNGSGPLTAWLIDSDLNRVDSVIISDGAMVLHGGSRPNDSTFVIYGGSNQMAKLYVLRLRHVPSAVNDVTQQLFSVYPNPATTLVTLTSGTKLDHIEVYNNIGQVVMTLRPAANSVYVDLSAVPPGLYIVRGRKGDKVTNVKLMKQ